MNNLKNKPKIIGINNSSDSIWFKLEGTIESLNCLDELFNIYELYPTPFIRPLLNEKYNNWIKNKPTDFLIDEDICLAYIILTPHIIHLILRKIKEYNKVKDNVNNNFSFIKNVKI